MDLKRHRINKGVQRISILGVGVDDISEEEAINEVFRLATEKKRHHFAVTINSEFVMLAYRDVDFARVIADADLSLSDGVGVVLSKLILGGKEQNRITGVDLIERVFANIGDKPIRIGFLGGFGNVAEVAKKRQLAKFPASRVVFAQAGDPTIGYDLKLREQINKAGGVDLLFVAYGMGQQEFWIKRNIDHIDVGLAIGVGGALDYIAGIKVRAPIFMQKMGLEWAWRLVNEPSRVWRMRVLPVFAVFVVGQWLLQNVQNVFLKTKKIS